MTYLVAGLAGMSVALVLRLFALWLQRGWFAQGFVGDSSIHLAMIRELKRDPRSEFIEQYLISEDPISYPRGFHRLCALLPLPLVRQHSWLPNLVLYVWFSGGFLAWTRYVEVVLLGRAGWTVTALAALFYFLSVSSFAFEGPAIAYLKLSERLLARLSCSAYFALLAAGLHFGDSLSLGLAIPAGAIAITSSIFARQALLFATVPMSLLLLDPWPAAALGAALMLGLLVSRRHLMRGLRYTVHHWLVYVSHTARSRIVQQVLSSVVSPRFLLDRDRTWHERLRHVFTREPGRSLLQHPELVFLGLLLALHPQAGLEWPELAALALASVAVYVATSTRWLHHLGESYRYLEYNLTFAAPLLIASVLAGLGEREILLLLPLYVAPVLALSAFFCLRARRLRYPDHDGLSEFLHRLSLTRRDTIFPVSMRLGADICARADCRSFWWQPGNVSRAIFDEFIEEYPYLRRDWRGLFDRFHVTHVICSKQALESLRSLDWEYDFSELERIAEDEEYVAYAVSDRAA